MNFDDVDDGALVASLREHIAPEPGGPADAILDELSIRLLRHTSYLARSRWVLAGLLHEASRASGHGEEAHAMLREQLDDGASSAESGIG
jgi:hypothetical protein